MFFLDLSSDHQPCSLLHYQQENSYKYEYRYIQDDINQFHVKRVVSLEPQLVFCFSGRDKLPLDMGKELMDNQIFRGISISYPISML